MSESLHTEAMADLQARWSSAAFIRDLGIELVDAGRGWVESALVVTPRMGQAHGYVHAGVVTTLADHTAGSAAATLVGPDQGIVSVEFKVNLLRPAVGARLRCRADVLRPGRRVTVVESKVFAIDEEGGEKLVSAALLTMAVVSRKP